MLKNHKSIEIFDYWWAYLIAICIAGLVIRLYFLPFDIPPVVDAGDYFGYALEIKNSGSLPINWPISNNGWPSILGIIFSIIPLEGFLDYVNLFRIVSIIFSITTIVVIYFVCSKFFGKYLGLIGAALFAFEPRIIMNSTTGLIEPLYICLIALVILLFFHKNIKSAYIAFALVAILSHVRYESLILIIPITIIYFLNFQKNSKNIQKYFLCLVIFLSVLIPFMVINYYTTGEDGITNQYFSAINRSSVQFIEGQDVYKELAEMESQESSYYLINGAWNFIKFIGILIIPVFIFFIPFGIYSILKNSDFRKKLIIIISVFLTLPAFYAYVNGFNDIRYLFTLYPILCFISLFSFEKILERMKKPKVLLISTIVVLIVVTIFSNFEYKEMYKYDLESFTVSQYVVKNATGYNQFTPEGKFVKAAEMENKWPETSIANLSGHIVRDTLLIKYDDSETLEKFIKNSRDIRNNPKYNTDPVHHFRLTNSTGNYDLDPLYYMSNGLKKDFPIGISHLVIDDNQNRPEFIRDVFKNEDNYPYLKKIFDSADFNFSYSVKIFEIDFEKFDMEK